MKENDKIARSASKINDDDLSNHTMTDNRYDN